MIRMIRMINRSHRTFITSGCLNYSFIGRPARPISGNILLKANLLCWCLPKRKSRWLFFLTKKIVHQKIPALQIAFSPPQPVQNPGWNWSFPPGVRSNLVACRNRPSRTSWAAVVAPWRNQCPWRHQCPAEVGILERKFFGQQKGGYIDFGGSRSWIFYRLLQLSENQRLCYSKILVKSAECVGPTCRIWNLPFFGDRSFIFRGCKNTLIFDMNTLKS